MNKSTSEGGSVVLGKRIRHTRRFQEILNVFLRNGFGHFLFRLGIIERQKKKASKGDITKANEHDIGKRLRSALQDLGPTFVKLGQIASTRRDLVPMEIAAELEKLQDDVQALPYETIKAIVESELEGNIENLFKTFNIEPLAAASIGQVHIAILPSGEEVAVKVQRPNIKHAVETDLEILVEIAKFLEEKTEWAKTYNIKEMIVEFGSSLRAELDYEIEGKNAERIAKQFNTQPKIRIPKIYWPHSTKKVLSMEMIHGIKVSNIKRLDEEGYDRKIIAERVVNAMFYQVLDKGFFHGDPHPGNIFILPGNVVVFLDFGMVGKINEDLKFQFASLIMQLQKGDSKGMIKTFDDMGLLDDDVDLNGLYNDLKDLKERYYGISLANISLGTGITELFEVAYGHKILIPNEITILAKVILTMEGLVEELDPTFSIMKAVEPFGTKLIKERYSPKEVLKTTWYDLVENVEIIANLPKDIKSITSTIKKGKLRLDINVQQLQKILNRFDKISNRLSFSIILLSFSILMVGLIIGSSISGQVNLLWRFPIIETASVVATLMFGYLLFSIFRSGRM